MRAIGVLSIAGVLLALVAAGWFLLRPHLNTTVADRGEMLAEKVDTPFPDEVPKPPNKGDVEQQTEGSDIVKPIVEPISRKNDVVTAPASAPSSLPSELASSSATSGKPITGVKLPINVAARQPEVEWQEAVSAQARLANVVIEVDKVLGFGERGEARLMVSRADLSEAEAETPEAKVMDRKLPVTYSVRAQAHSRKLKVFPEGYTEKTLVGTNVAIWSWQIEGTEKVDTSATLTVDLEHKIFVDGTSLFIPVQTFPHTVMVKVGWMDRVVDWTVGLGAIEKLLLTLAAVVVAAGGVWFSIRKLFRGEAASG